jgi:hypothetical protein
MKGSPVLLRISAPSSVFRHPVVHQPRQLGFLMFHVRGAAEVGGEQLALVGDAILVGVTIGSLPDVSYCPTNGSI